MELSRAIEPSVFAALVARVGEGAEFEATSGFSGIRGPTGGERDSMKTFSAKPSDITKKWYVIDASGQPLGRLASQIAYVLRGKHKAIFTPHMDTGDNVIVVNADKVVLTGNKENSKAYYRHSGYFGGLKTTYAFQMREKHPERLIEFAVKGMLPHNSLGRKVYKNMKVYAGPEHPHAAQNPEVLPDRTVKSQA